MSTPYAVIPTTPLLLAGSTGSHGRARARDFLTRIMMTTLILQAGRTGSPRQGAIAVAGASAVMVVR
jgi:hypothetical protein